MLNDVDMSVLVSGPDKDKLKTISRAEVTTAKIHSSTTSVPPVFVFVTSNQHLMKHYFDNPGGISGKKPYDIDIKIKVSNVKDLKAVRNRFIEIFVRKIPPLPTDALPLHGTFTRKNFINATYTDMLKILFKYQKDDFSSPYLYLYPLAGLSKNIPLLHDKAQEFTKMTIIQLMELYKLNEEEKNQIIFHM